MNAFPIQSDTESTAEWITNGVNGLLVDPNNPLEIADAIRKAVDDDTLIKKAAEINSTLTFQKLDISLVKPKVVEMYRLLAADDQRTKK